MSNPIIIAGPCAAESREQLFGTAQQIADIFSEKGISLTYFRAGIWKPRSNPDDFSGAGRQALSWLREIERDFHFAPCVEIARPEHAAACAEEGITNFWIGSRTTVNPFLVQEIADAISGLPCTVMVKNPINPDLNLWAGGIERFLKNGNSKVLAIHRGFSQNSESIYRNAPIWQIPIELKLRFPEIPLICDPSHITGDPSLIASVSQIALDFGFDGLMIETHINPAAALSDSKQQITPAMLAEIISSLIFKSQTTSPTEEALRKQRTILYNIDSQIAELLVKRMQIIDNIAVIKKDNNLPFVQPQQWGKVVENYKSKALDDQQYKIFLDKFLELLHQQSIERQSKKQ